MDELQILRRRVERERKARGIAESMLEDRSRELYHANQVLQQAQNDLEQRVNERTEQLAIATELLKEAADQSQAANQAKSAFLARMSHEIRTPMNCLIGLTEVLLNTELSDLQRDYLQTIESSASSLLEIINDILDFSRIEAGKMTISATEFSLRSEIDQMIRPLAVRAHLKRLEIMVDIESDVPHLVVGDPVRIRQILVNLIGNAIKFTQTGSVSLHVDMQYRMESSAVLRFRVRDSGIGIPQEKIESIFHAFDQGDEETEHQFGGSGLGLAICRQLTDLIDGEISASSVDGSGSEFTLTIEMPVASFYYEPDREALKVVRGRRLLIVSSSPQLRDQNEQISKRWKCQCMTANDIMEVRLLLHENRRCEEPVDIALIDTAGLRQDGMPLLRNIAELHPDCHVVLLNSIVGTQGDAIEDGNALPDLQQLAEQTKLRISAMAKPVYEDRLLEHLYKQLTGVSQSAVRQGDPSQLPDGLKILLVDDSPVNRKVFRAMFDRAPVVITEAENGLEAVELVMNQTFDVVLMDVRMPVMNGLDATRKIRRLPNTAKAQVLVIALTANALETEHRKCMDAGMHDFLTKPFSRETLCEKILQNLHGASGVPIQKSDDRPNSTTTPREASTPAPKLSSSAPIDGRKMFDHAFAMRQVGGNLELLKQLYDIFDETFLETNSKLTHAILDSDRENIGLHAHSLKGALRALGGATPSEIAESIEHECESATLESIRSLQSQLQGQVERFQEEMNNFVRSAKE